MEALRTIKETAEQPEREAKERHLKAWEGKLNCDIISPSSCFPVFYISHLLNLWSGFCLVV